MVICYEEPIIVERRPIEKKCNDGKLRPTAVVVWFSYVVLPRE